MPSRRTLVLLAVLVVGGMVLAGEPWADLRPELTLENRGTSSQVSVLVAGTGSLLWKHDGRN